MKGGKRPGKVQEAGDNVEPYLRPEQSRIDGTYQRRSIYRYINGLCSGGLSSHHPLWGIAMDAYLWDRTIKSSSSRKMMKSLGQYGDEGWGLSERKLKCSIPLPWESIGLAMTERIRG